jgi:hypothetical protein
MKFTLPCLLAFSALVFCCSADDKPLYQNDFENAEVGKVPGDFLVLDGGFVVKLEDKNKFLELPGSPLDSFAVQFGPTESTNVAVSARINGTGKGRRFPVFGIGLSGVAGYKLQVSPAKEALEIVKDQAAVASIHFSWKSGAWTNLRLQVHKVADHEIKIEGKAWQESTQEPSAWMVSFDEKEEPVSGRASVFGSPFSGTRIQFDDFLVTRVPAPN